MALKTKKKTAAKPAPEAAPKLKQGKGKAKATKALKGKSTPKEPKLAVKVGQEVEFLGYAETPDEPVFETGDRLTITAVGKNDDGQQVFEAVKSEDYIAYQENPDDVQGDECFATEIKKAEKLPDDPYKFELADDERLDALLEDNDGDPLAAANAAIENIASNMFLLGGCFAKLYASRKFLEYGEDGEYADTIVDGNAKTGTGWDKFCQENFDMGGRKAHGMIQIYRNYNALGEVVDLDELSSNKKIGWVKLAAAANVITKANAAELVEKMKSENVNEFKESIKTDYVDAGAGGETRSTTAKVKRMTFKAVFYEDAGVAVNAVIEAAKKQLSTDDLGTVLEYIIMSWAATELSDTAQKKVRSARKAKLSELKKQGVDTADRLAHMTNLEAQIEDARSGEEPEEEEEEGGEE